MEKPGNESKYVAARLLKGPLLFICILIFNSTILAAETQISDDIRSLHIVSQRQNLFTSQEECFSFVIPGMLPSEVQASESELPEGVTFVSSRKTGIAGDGGMPATKIEIWLIFNKSGSIDLPSLNVYVKNRLYHIPFESVRVYENPQTIMPRLSVKFQAETDSADRIANEVTVNRNSSPPFLSIPAGQKLHFTLYIQYAVQLMHFSWVIPKDSLFTEVKRYEITKGEPRGNDFIPDEIPVARFEWEPLKSGEYNMPDIKITATAYNGSHVNLRLPDFKVKVLPADKASERNNMISGIADDGRYLFSSAFTENETPQSETVKKSAGLQNFERIAELRSRERHSLPFCKFRTLRRAAESAAELPPGEDEPSIPLLFVFLVALIASFIIAIILMEIHKSGIAAIFFAVTFLCATGLIIESVRLSADYGVFTGGTLNPVPEVLAVSSAPVNGGNRVRIREQVGKWVYIEYNSTGGWVLRSTILFIH